MNKISECCVNVVTWCQIIWSRWNRGQTCNFAVDTTGSLMVKFYWSIKNFSLAWTTVMPQPTIFWMIYVFQKLWCLLLQNRDESCGLTVDISTISAGVLHKIVEWTMHTISIPENFFSEISVSSSLKQQLGLIKWVFKFISHSGSTQKHLVSKKLGWTTWNVFWHALTINDKLITITITLVNTFILSWYNRHLQDPISLPCCAGLLIQQWWMSRQG